MNEYTISLPNAAKVEVREARKLIFGKRRSYATVLAPWGEAIDFIELDTLEDLWEAVRHASSLPATAQANLSLRYALQPCYNTIANS